MVSGRLLALFLPVLREVGGGHGGGQEDIREFGRQHLGEFDKLLLERIIEPTKDLND